MPFSHLQHREDVPALDATSVHLWAWKIGEVATDRMEFLPMAEQEQVAALHVDSVRQQTLASRVGIRHVLSMYRDIQPQDLVFERSEFGKPRLASERDGGLHFNASHSGEWVVAAVRRRPVGIDFEQHRQVTNAASLARRIMTDAELANWQSLDENAQLSEFFRNWTAKEAVTKLDGRGLQLAMQSIDLQPDSTEIESTAWRAKWADGSCHVLGIALDEASLAVATERTPASILQQRLSFA